MLVFRWFHLSKTRSQSHAPAESQDIAAPKLIHHCRNISVMITDAAQFGINQMNAVMTGCRIVFWSKICDRFSVQM